MLAHLPGHVRTRPPPSRDRDLRPSFLTWHWQFNAFLMTLRRKKLVPYKIISDDGKPAIEVNDKKYQPEEISAMVLGKMKDIAERCAS